MVFLQDPGQCEGLQQSSVCPGMEQGPRQEEGWRCKPCWSTPKPTLSQQEFARVWPSSVTKSQRCSRWGFGDSTLGWIHGEIWNPPIPSSCCRVPEPGQALISHLVPGISIPEGSVLPGDSGCARETKLELALLPSGDSGRAEAALLFPFFN